MSGFLQVIAIGNIGRVEELRYLQSGVPVLNFSLAVNQVSGSGENRQEKTIWIRVALWRQLAESLKPYLEKGKQVMVVGTIEARAYAGSDGTPQASIEMTARDVRLLGSRGDGQGQGQYEEFAGGAGGSDNISDIPF
jgi:single-strand DNA-binding protein